MIKKAATVLVALALSIPLVGCNGGDDDCREDEARGSDVTLMVMGERTSGGTGGSKAKVDFDDFDDD